MDDVETLAWIIAREFVAVIEESFDRMLELEGQGQPELKRSKARAAGQAGPAEVI